jgi:hypothetical protein
VIADVIDPREKKAVVLGIVTFGRGVWQEK